MSETIGMPIFENVLEGRRVLGLSGFKKDPGGHPNFGHPVCNKLENHHFQLPHLQKLPLEEPQTITVAVIGEDGEIEFEERSVLLKTTGTESSTGIVLEGDLKLGSVVYNPDRCVKPYDENVRAFLEARGIGTDRWLFARPMRNQNLKEVPPAEAVAEVYRNLIERAIVIPRNNGTFPLLPFTQ